MEELEGKIVEQKGRFVLRYGYNSSMDFANVIITLTEGGVSLEELNDIVVEMLNSGIPAKHLANYLADHYNLFNC